MATIIKFSIQHDLGQVMILHPGDVPSVSKLCHEEYRLDAGDFDCFEDFNVADQVSPVDLESGRKAALMEMPKEAQMVAIKGPRLGAVQEGREHDSFIDTDFHVLQVVITPDTLESVRGTVCFGQSTLNFFVGLGV